MDSGTSFIFIIAGIGTLIFLFMVFAIFVLIPREGTAEPVPLPDPPSKEEEKVPTPRLSLVAPVSLVAGFIHGLSLLSTNATFLRIYSFYYWIIHSLPEAQQETARVFFRSEFVFLSLPISGALLGALVGWIAARSIPSPAKWRVVQTGARNGFTGSMLTICGWPLNIYSS